MAHLVGEEELGGDEEGEGFVGVEGGAEAGEEEGDVGVGDVLDVGGVGAGREGECGGLVVGFVVGGGGSVKARRRWIVRYCHVTCPAYGCFLDRDVGCVGPFVVGDDAFERVDDFACGSPC